MVLSWKTLAALRPMYRLPTSGTSSTLSQENLFVVNPQRGFEIVGKPSIKIESKNPENWVVEVIDKNNSVEGDIPAIGDYIYITISGIAGARFYLTIDDINDISILEEPLDNIEIPENGLYRFLQRFPEITNTSVTNKFKINLKVGDGTFLNRNLPTTDPM